jgi:hypothetical protein
MTNPRSEYVAERLKAIEQEQIAKRRLAAKDAKPGRLYNEALDDEPDDFFAYIWPDIA